jgi:hypothetical protein
VKTYICNVGDDGHREDVTEQVVEEVKGRVPIGGFREEPYSWEVFVTCSKGHERKYVGVYPPDQEQLDM